MTKAKREIKVIREKEEKTDIMVLTEKTVKMAKMGKMVKTGVRIPESKL